MFFISIIWLLSGCFLSPYPNDPKPANPRGVPTSELLLDESSFPPEWIIHICQPHCEISPSKSSRSFYRIDFPGHVLQDVFYYRTERDAKAKFQRYDETTGGSYPSGISYLSPIADEQYLRCRISEQNDIKECRVARRYDNYFVYFYFDIDAGYHEGLPSIQDVEPILQALDELIAEQLDIPLPTIRDE